MILKANIQLQMGNQDDAYEIIQNLLGSQAISLSYEKNNDSQNQSTAANTMTQYSQEQLIENNLMGILDDEQ